MTSKVEAEAGLQEGFVLARCAVAGGLLLQGVRGGGGAGVQAGGALAGLYERESATGG
jgi:hypothetical protein